MEENFNIQIKNFQSLSNVELVIEDGLNIIVGKTNSGKSATLRAIDAALFNIGDDDKVKSGKRYAGVSINNSKNTVIWRRDSQSRNEKTMYQIDSGNPITKVGRNQLPEVASLFNITDVRLANGAKEKINFWYQGAAPFLMDKTAGQLFEFLSQSSCDKYIKVVKKLEVDMKTQKSGIESVNASIDAYRNINKEKKEYIDKNKGFTDLYTNIVILNKDVSTFNQIEEIISKNESLKARIYIKAKELNIIDSIIGNIKFNNINIEFDSICVINDDLLKIRDCIENLKRKRDTKKISKGSLIKIKSKLLLSESILKKNKISMQELEDLNYSTNEIRILIDKMEYKKNKKEDIQKEIDKLGTLLISVNLKSIENKKIEIETEENIIKDIQNVVEEYLNKENKINTKKEEFEDVLIEFENATNSFKDFKTEIGYCPYCESRIENI